jgi:hypothetical protein
MKLSSLTERVDVKLAASGFQVLEERPAFWTKVPLDVRS